MVIAAMKLNDAYSLDRTEVLWLRWTAQGIGEVLPLAQGRGGVREEQPHVQGAVAAQAQEGERSYSTFKVRTGDCEEIPLVQGKEQRLRFAGAALKRYPRPR